MKSLKTRYQEEICPALQKKFSYKNILAIPRLEKVVLNVGLSKALGDERFLEVMHNTLQRITGQQPVYTTAKKSISNFKIRQGMKVGLTVTLRGQKMYDFVDRLIHFALPRVRDFSGIPEKSIDHHGNITIGFKEHIAFPEIKSDEVDRIHGLEVSLKTTAQDRESGIELLKQIGLPLVK